MPSAASPIAAPPGDNPLVSVRDLSFRYGDRIIFRNVDLDIPRGKVTAIMGPSGTGKTTFLRLISGQLRPDSGLVEVDGQNVRR
jgi:ABC-type transport system involved in resistance to organic solvents, ATPase component